MQYIKLGEDIKLRVFSHRELYQQETKTEASRAISSLFTASETSESRFVT